MSEIHIGPHTRDGGHGPGHGSGDSGHTFDREIDLKSIAKWMIALLVTTAVCEGFVVLMVRGLDRQDAKGDPPRLPIQATVEQPAPPLPRLQVGERFDRLNPDAPPLTRSDVEDMEALRAEEDARLNTAAWQDQAQGRVRVPIDVAMQVIASRGGQAAGSSTAAPPQPAPAPQEP